CTKKNKRHRAFSHAVSDSIFIPGLVFELNLMTLLPREVSGNRKSRYLWRLESLFSSRTLCRFSLRFANNLQKYMLFGSFVQTFADNLQICRLIPAFREKTIPFRLNKLHICRLLSRFADFVSINLHICRLIEGRLSSCHIY
ncbi:hypothetical protein ACFPPD_26485, partial [Cohnella suwonensis]